MNQIFAMGIFLNFESSVICDSIYLNRANNAIYNFTKLAKN